MMAIGQIERSIIIDYSTEADNTRNQALIYTISNGVRYFNTDDIIRIEIDNENNVTVEQTIGSYTYRNEVREISFKKASRNRISASKHFLVENEAVNKYLNEADYHGFKGSVITEYAVESGFRMDWPREFSFSTLPRNAEEVYYKIWECWTDVLLFEGKGTPSHIEGILNHLQPGSAYIYELTGLDMTPIVKDSLQLDGGVRMIRANNTLNIRDIGGWQTTDGKRVKYGRIFRGGRFRDVTGEDVSLLIDQLGINVEIDLRSEEELKLDDEDASNDLNYPILGDNILYYSFPMPLSGFINKDTVYLSVFRTVLSSLKQGKNVYIHCAGGADRTGTIILMLEALLGMEDSEMAKDYELTSFAPGYYDKNNYRYLDRCTSTFDHFSAISGKKGTTKEITTCYLLLQGVTQEEIDSFRAIMLVP